MNSELQQTLTVLLSSWECRIFLVGWSIWFILDAGMKLYMLPLKHSLQQLEIEKLKREVRSR